MEHLLLSSAQLNFIRNSLFLYIDLININNLWTLEIPYMLVWRQIYFNIVFFYVMFSNKYLIFDFYLFGICYMIENTIIRCIWRQNDIHCFSSVKSYIMFHNASNLTHYIFWFLYQIYFELASYFYLVLFFSKEKEFVKNGVVKKI